ncbi:hypothetical protein GUJ93_ZPchr0003g16726 [Zizania palustris]|uniref:Uncharacterized protein n=1 Tax=Zizania palustris TaxID=103762 RepID=A0A8J5SM95_ZIZPA|nr:hypothetical protein GUJ93_ZPchr0003g16726 [Zizania palustris]
MLRRWARRLRRRETPSDRRWGAPSGRWDGSEHRQGGSGWRRAGRLRGSNSALNSTQGKVKGKVVIFIC